MVSMLFEDVRLTWATVAATAFAIGVVFGSSLVSVFVFNRPELFLAVLLLSTFHITEFLQTAAWNLPKLSWDSFMINQSFEYQVAVTVCFFEYGVEAWFFPSMKSFFLFKSVGFVLAAGGLACRIAAMYHAKSNFSHIVAEQKREEHELVTDGIYAYSRHPSYFGFYWYTVGMQVLLCNPISVVSHALASWKFFYERIPDEEIYLEKFFGEKYVEYKKKVPIGIPFLK
eukprot:Lithocolla_globosa_v1_NODE_750_length_3334_cov_26.166819.p2 type:complete len:228 gc:universal NODE_750_length_3334_cov_26.166819:864-181(-)